MLDEISSLQNNGTQELILLLFGKSIISCSSNFSIQVGPYGTIDRVKARIVATE